jgi:hypothetical protein
MSRWERLSPLAGVVAVALWLAGLAITKAPDTSTDKTDAQILSVYQHHADNILLGSWLFMLGCVFFLWFAGTLRSRMAEAEGGRMTFRVSPSAAPPPQRCSASGRWRARSRSRSTRTTSARRPPAR